MEHYLQPQYGIWSRLWEGTGGDSCMCGFQSHIQHRVLIVLAVSWLQLTDLKHRLSWPGALENYTSIWSRLLNWRYEQFLPCSTIWAQLSRLHHISSCIVYDLAVVYHDVIVVLYYSRYAQFCRFGVEADFGWNGSSDKGKNYRWGGGGRARGVKHTSQSCSKIAASL